MKVKHPDAYKRMRDARARLCFHKPYFGVALWAVRFVEVEGFIDKVGAPLAADKHWRVYYDPEFVLTCTLPQLMAGILHELGHLVRGHSDRATAFGISDTNHRQWNTAGDCELNDDLEKDPEVDMKGLPWPYVTPNKLQLPEEKMTEWYYQNLPDPPPQNSNCGSAAHGQPQGWEVNDDTAPKVGKAEGKLIQKYVADAVRNEARKSQGNVPGGWERWADAFGTPIINWRQQLSALLRNQLATIYGNFDYSYAKPNRRQSLYSQVIMPAMIQPVPKLATIIDTSGSMSKKDLTVCMTEIGGILEAVGVGEVTNYVVDVDVQGGRRITSLRDIELTGGGGTDMRVGIAKALDDAHGTLDIIIVLTDGFTPWPTEDACRGTKIIAVLTTGESMPAVPPYIKAVSID